MSRYSKLNPIFLWLTSKLKPIFLWLNRYTPPRALFQSIFCDYLEANDGVYTFYNEATDAKKRQALSTVGHIKSETEILNFSDIEACQLSALVDATAKIEGDVAEVGTYKGGSAKIICEGKGDRPLHLFDTFEGLPEVNKEVDKSSAFIRYDSNSSLTQYAVGQFAAPLEIITNYLKKYPNVFFYKGIFPSTATPIKGKKFSFVHLDVDTYTSTLSCLEFFYPRMNKGGIILSHDYLRAVGLTKAFDEFFEGRPEPIISLTGKQCLIMKLSDCEMSD